jgi:DNA-binding GntR family transcriptional regulator
MLAARLASPLELTHLETLAREVDELSAQVDAKRYVDLHRMFHQQIAACCHCEPLYEAVDQCHAFATLWLSQIPRPSVPNSLHQELVAAIASRDPITAADAVTQHLAYGVARAIETLPPAAAKSGSPAPFRRRRRR